MGTIERLAEKLADDTIKAMQELDDERLYVEVGDVLASASQSLEEAFLTEMRVRLAERTARAFLTNKVKFARKQAPTEPQPAPAAPRDG